MSIRPVVVVAIQILALCTPAIGRGRREGSVTYGPTTKLSQEAYRQILDMLEAHMTRVARESTSRRPHSPVVQAYTEITLTSGRKTYRARTDLALRGSKIRDGKSTVVGAWLTTLDHWKLADGTKIPPGSKVHINPGHGTVKPARGGVAAPAKRPRTRGRRPQSPPGAKNVPGGAQVRIRIKEPFLVLEGSAGGGVMGQNCTFTLHYEKRDGCPPKAECMREFGYKIRGRAYMHSSWTDFEMPKPRGEKKTGFFAPGTVHVSGEGRVRIYLRDAAEKAISNILVIPVAGDAATAKALRKRFATTAKPKPQPEPKRPAADDEAKAAKLLKFSRMCLANGADKLAVTKLKEILGSYPKTKAAKDARAILKSRH